MTRFFTELPVNGNIVFGFGLPGVDVVVSYSTAILLNFRFRRVLCRVGVKFSFNESDSKLPNRHVCRTFNASWKFWRSSESLKIEFDWHSLMSMGPSAGLELSSVGCGAHAKMKIKPINYTVCTCTFVQTYANCQLIEFDVGRPNSGQLEHEKFLLTLASDHAKIVPYWLILCYSGGQITGNYHEFASFTGAIWSVFLAILQLSIHLSTVSVDKNKD